MLDLLASFSPTVQSRIEIYRREAITLFLLATDFIEVSGDADVPEVTYLGIEAGCRNPFAEFSA